MPVMVSNLYPCFAVVIVYFTTVYVTILVQYTQASYLRDTLLDHAWLSPSLLLSTVLWAWSV